MNNRLFCIAVLILCLSSSITMALAPIGPPVVNLEKGQWSIGFDYSDTEIDFKLKNIQGTSFFTRNKANEVEIENTMGKLCYGINDVSIGRYSPVSESQKQNTKKWYRVWMEVFSNRQ
jgi:hypothetical protein